MYTLSIAALTAINLQSYFLTTWNEVLGTGYSSKKIGRSIADSFLRKYRYRYHRYFQQEVLVSVAVICASIVNTPAVWLICNRPEGAGLTHSGNSIKGRAFIYQANLLAYSSHIPIRTRAQTSTQTLDRQGPITSAAHSHLPTPTRHRAQDPMAGKSASVEAALIGWRAKLSDQCRGGITLAKSRPSPSWRALFKPRAKRPPHAGYRYVPSLHRQSHQAIDVMS